MDSVKTNTEQNLPIVMVDVPRKAIDELKGLEPGNTVRVVLTGQVVEVSQREPDVSYPGFSGMLRVEVKTTKIMKQDNSFAELAEDDD